MIKIPPQAKGLIFDLDGTVADTMPHHFLSWRKAVIPHGIDFNPQLFLEMTGMPRKATIERLNDLFGTNMSVEEVGNAKSEYFETLVDTTKEVKIVAEVIRKYQQILPMSIGTGSTKYGAKRTLEVIGMDKYFDIVITCDDVEKHKPHPETFLKCAHLMGVNPKECLVFEDGVLGMQAAKDAGMMVIDVNDYYKLEMVY